ncbi:Dyp-type peroxidase [Blastococcus deserti]|uniref:Dyp-type peroxidase n=1 Tax=Blastococcus deserti TaxID=2259033 RepID=A0ABW4X8R8_9ACTN
MIDLDRALDLDDPEADDFLAAIQGNIVKGHGRDFTAHVLLRMGDDVPAVRRWIAGLAAERVTTALVARRATLAWRGTGGPGEPFAMVLLSASGYRHLGFPDEQLPVPSGRFVGPRDREYFEFGMKEQAGRPRSFNDPPASEWEEPYRQRIDAMVLLADDDEQRLSDTVDAVVASTAGVADVLTTERGRVLRRTFPRGTLVIEHFGFQDGVSQPIMVQQDADREIKARGNVHWDPTAPLSLALVPEPGGGFGSFMVFRKLEQDVAALHRALRDLSVRAGLPVAEVGAMAVGRFEDGAPAVPTGTVDPDADPNDFHYDQDPAGTRSPFHSHVRKTNPRGDVPRVIGAPAEFERARRIVRRGITYGERPDLADGGGTEAPATGVGLLFMCFQGNLDQFAIQQEGSDSNDFVRAGVGVDAVIGQNAQPAAQTWPSDGTVTFTMANFVKLLGGEYFFAPSMAFLRGLDAGPEPTYGDEAR